LPGLSNRADGLGAHPHSICSLGLGASKGSLCSASHLEAATSFSSSSSALHWCTHHSRSHYRHPSTRSSTRPTLLTYRLLSLTGCRLLIVALHLLHRHLRQPILLEVSLGRQPAFWGRLCLYHALAAALRHPHHHYWSSRLKRTGCRVP